MTISASSRMLIVSSITWLNLTVFHYYNLPSLGILYNITLFLLLLDYICLVYDAYDLPCNHVFFINCAMVQCVYDLVLAAFYKFVHLV